MDLSRILESPSQSTLTPRDSGQKTSQPETELEAESEDATRLDEVNDVDPAASSLSFSEFSSCWNGVQGNDLDLAVIAIEAKAEVR